MNINQDAPIVASHNIAIAAEIQTVWDALTQIDRWPDWNTEISSARLNGTVAVGTTFQWKTAGLVISSTIGECEPLKRIGWSGKAGGILGIHVWTLASTSAGTEVRTEESWEGGEMPGPVEAVQTALDESLIRWLSALKLRAEFPQ